MKKMFGILYLSFSDNIKVKEKMISKRNKKKKKVGDTEEQESEFFEDAPPFDENASFYQMNLSRPLLKVQLHIKVMFSYQCKETTFSLCICLYCYI